jgi:hypothetical protein
LCGHRREITAQIRFVFNLLVSINPDLAAPLPPAASTDGAAGGSREEPPLSSPTPLGPSKPAKITSRVQLNILKKVKKAAAAATATTTSTEKKELS